MGVVCWCVCVGMFVCVCVCVCLCVFTNMHSDHQEAPNHPDLCSKRIMQSLSSYLCVCVCMCVFLSVCVLGVCVCLTKRLIHSQHQIKRAAFPNDITGRIHKVFKPLFIQTSKYNQ